MPKYKSVNGDLIKVYDKPVYVEPEVEITVEDKPLDLNKDGKIDTKDASIAGKVMNEVKKRKYTKKKKVKKDK